jgi:hypothetical protein
MIVGRAGFRQSEKRGDEIPILSQQDHKIGILYHDLLLAPPITA